ncbi:NAD-binding protein [Absicoccus intestinalis]|uniref:NAD-binding protein n=1 Tax=Absicoccus intestinalis TaxID=2926319 RepID=A0ABU4WLA3_9FIRM|nr:NAD-binding protein [Absicoccus sp. CLA-KB-P134]MDX8417318.1 NAD-binding protein [Absicoccus sp. CLA-KB-P134]
MSNIVCIGAGQTGRGFINRFFRNDRVIFLDKNDELVKKLQERKEYSVSFGSTRSPMTLNNFEAYDINSSEAMDSLSNANLIMISIGRNHLKELTKPLESALKKNTEKSIDIVLCENGVNVKRELSAIESIPGVHLAEAIIFCTTLKEKNSLDIFSEDLDYLPYDAIALGHKLNYENLVPEEHLDILMQRKIYTYNCISAIISYLGYYKGYEIYSDAANDEDINLCIQNIVHTLNQCICREYNIAEKEQERFSNLAIRKFKNKEIIDTVERNARDVDRKLGEKERIIAPLLIMNKYGVFSKDLLLVAASAIYYGEKTNTLKKLPSDYFKILPKKQQDMITQYVDDLFKNKKGRI